jgi:hypothetical protein
VVVSSEHVGPITIDLTRTAAISGEVLDSRNRPLQMARVIAVVRRSVNGQSRLAPFGDAVVTDDGGRYRLYGLPPGHYSVAVVPTGVAIGADVFAPVCFPGSGAAVFFELKPGETRNSMNLVVPNPEAPSISGKASGLPPDLQPSRAAVSLVARDGLRVPIATVWTNADGAFVIGNVPPGEYRLTAWTPLGGLSSTSGPLARANARWAARSVSVSGADLQVDIELQPLVRVQGRLIWEGSPARDYPCSGAKQIVFHSEEGWLDVWSPAVAVNGDRFTVEGLPAGRFSIEMPGLGDSCRLASVLVGNEVLRPGAVSIDGAAPLTLVLTAARGAVSGVVTASAAKPGTALVVLLPTDGEGPMQVDQVSAEGRYRFDQVLAGEYLVLALDGLSSADYLDPVEALRLGAKPVVVGAGIEATCNLRLIQR